MFVRRIETRRSRRTLLQMRFDYSAFFDKLSTHFRSARSHLNNERIEVCVSIVDIFVLGTFEEADECISDRRH